MLTNHDCMRDHPQKPVLSQENPKTFFMYVLIYRITNPLQIQENTGQLALSN